MSVHWPRTSALMTCLSVLLCSGCRGVPGRPGPAAERPSQVLNFDVLYSRNCAACHGKDGQNGAAISLHNPTYLEVAGVGQIERITADGVPGSLMPPFAKNRGGMLTEQQIGILAQGMVSAWGHADAQAATQVGQAAPPYLAAAPGSVADGQTSFHTFCGRCHGEDGRGTQEAKTVVGSIVDPAYLALISDQGLRSLILAGQPAQGMPDWRSDMQGPDARAMTDREVTDVVAWLASHRTSAPGQPYAGPAD